MNRKTRIPLVLKDWVALGCSLFFLLMGLFLLVTTAQMSKLICQRTQPIQGTCELTRVNFLGTISTRRWQLSEIQKLEFHDNIYEIHLITAEGEIHLMPFYESTGKSESKGHRIFVYTKMTKFFLDTREKTLAIEEDDRSLGYFTGFMFIGASLIFVIGRGVEIYTTRARIVLNRRK